MMCAVDSAIEKARPRLVSMMALACLSHLCDYSPKSMIGKTGTIGLNLTPKPRQRPKPAAVESKTVAMQPNPTKGIPFTLCSPPIERVSHVSMSVYPIAFGT